jgi:hypothetical protein
MPRMNGRELAARLSEVRPEIQVLYVSDYANGIVRDGVHRAMGKSSRSFRSHVRPLALTRKVREILDSQRVNPAKRSEISLAIGRLPGASSAFRLVTGAYVGRASACGYASVGTCDNLHLASACAGMRTPCVAPSLNVQTHTWLTFFASINKGFRASLDAISDVRRPEWTMCIALRTADSSR